MSASAMLSRVNELPKIPKVLQELVEMVNQEEVDLMQLSKKISMEQVVSARILRMSNSAHFGRSRTIASVDEAVIRLGVEPIRTLLVVSVLVSAFPKVKGLDMSVYWNDTFEIATIASNVAKKAGLDGNQAFTAGMLHNIGELMIHTLAEEEAMQIVQRVEKGEEKISAQSDVLGITAPELGAKLAVAWKFAPQLVDSIEHYLEPEKAEKDPKMATALHFAYEVNQKWDDFEDEDKTSFVDSNDDVRRLALSNDIVGVLDEARGQGRSMAEQIV
ncbi:HDOD domain-containing protein [Thaumasiovibrio subtropicus]|uniref:HDOD domain-containing protein n=1 Tax=Thaumasiovibrio subtropicus TaxID=1891207 RepID=UPI000B353B3D|nr:HDOD domain-containing protein [Thaumasiovibrio subtropicus]